MAKQQYLDLAGLEVYDDEIKAYVDDGLSGKANSSHNHAASNITSGTLSSDRLPTVPVSKGGTGSTTAAGALTNLGLTATAAELNKMDGVTATTTELNYVDGVTSNIQTQLDGKAASSHSHTIIATATDDDVVVLTGTNGTNKVTFDAKHAASGVTAGTYKSVTVDAKGHVTAGTNPTTISGYGITDAYTKTQVDTIANGKAASSHTHTKSQITDFPSSLKNPNSLTIQGNGTTLTNGTYDGSAAKTVNITASAIGAAASSHTHDDRYYTESEVDTKLAAKANSSHTHSYAGSSSAGGSATSAVKLDTTTAGSSTVPVYFTSGKPAAVSSVAESYLSWGGKMIAGGVSPIDAAASSIHSANRFQFAKPAGITVEYSTDGSTFTDYGATNAEKIALVSGIGTSFMIGKRSGAGKNTVNDKVRITLNATNMGTYTRLQKLLINITTNYASGSNVKVEKAMKGSESTFSTIGTYNISGWSGWNSIPILTPFGGSSTQTSQIATLRLTFGITGVNSSQNSALTVLDIVGVGDTYWNFPSNMAKTGHLYSWDTSQNMTLPAALKFPTVSSKTPYVGHATDQSDGTFLLGSLTGTTYQTGLAIGGGSGNLLWKGNKVAVTSDISLSTLGITATAAELNYVDGVTSNIQTQLNGKAASSHTHDDRYYTESEVDSKLSGKAASSHSHSDATTSAAGFMTAAMVTKLNGIATGANAYSLPTATSSVLGGVKVGSNITVSSGTISLTKANVTAALGYTPPTSDTNTTYSAGTGISLSGTTFSNSGVRSIATGSSNGTISVNTNGSTANVAVKGLGSAAYTNSSAYAAASHTHSYLPLSGGSLTGALSGTSISLSGNLNASGVHTNRADAGLDISAQFVDFGGNIIVPNATSYSSYDTSTTPVRKSLLFLSASGNVHIGANTTSDNCHSGNTYINAKSGNVYLCNSENSLIYNMSSGVGYFRPTVNGDDCLGGSSYRWSNIYSKTAVNTSSDYYQKENIEPVPQKYIDMLDDIEPVIFKFKTGDRLHGGYISQWVEESMGKYDITAEEFGAFCKDPKLDENENIIEGEYDYSLRYSEFVPIIHAKVKQLESRYNEKLEELNGKIAELEAKLNIE